jgi:hypothetical protein
MVDETLSPTIEDVAWALIASQFGLSAEQLEGWMRCGATPREAAEILPRFRSPGVDGGNYFAGRSQGFSHTVSTAMEIRDVKLHRLLVGNVTPAEASAAIVSGVHFRGYVWAREHGATHTEALAAASLDGMDLFDYGHARKQGHSHEEIVDAHAHGIDIETYLRIRTDHLSHDEALLGLATRTASDADD